MTVIFGEFRQIYYVLKTTGNILILRTVNEKN